MDEREHSAEDEIDQSAIDSACDLARSVVEHPEDIGVPTEPHDTPRSKHHVEYDVDGNVVLVEVMRSVPGAASLLARQRWHLDETRLQPERVETISTMASLSEVADAHIIVTGNKLFRAEYIDHQDPTRSHVDEDVPTEAGLGMASFVVEQAKEALKPS